MNQTSLTLLLFSAITALALALLLGVLSLARGCSDAVGRGNARP